MRANKFLFLDRDGVINIRLPGAYVSRVEDFTFAPKALEALAFFAQSFSHIVIVTNQQGIGKGLMTEDQLSSVHDHLRDSVRAAGGRIDGIYHCSALATQKAFCRKPNPGMAFQAKQDFPEINFSQSIIVGDSRSDLELGKRLGMQTVLIKSNPEEVARCGITVVDRRFDNLCDFAYFLGMEK